MIETHNNTKVVKLQAFWQVVKHNQRRCIYWQNWQHLVEYLVNLSKTEPRINDRFSRQREESLQSNIFIKFKKTCKRTDAFITNAFSNSFEFDCAQKTSR